MGCLPSLRAQKRNTEFIKQVSNDHCSSHWLCMYVPPSRFPQLYARLSTETFFGSKEFTLGYHVADTLYQQSLRY